MLVVFAVRTVRIACCLALLMNLSFAEDAQKPAKEAKPCANVLPDGVTERSLFDGKTLAGWKVTKFGGEGPVVAAGGILELGFRYLHDGRYV